MSIRVFFLALLLSPLVALGQKSASPADGNPVGSPDLNATTRTVLLANRPAQFTEGEWLRMMEKSVNRSLYPLRVTREMLDTLDTKALDLRFRYEMTP
ncbi:MAG: hypothetical protein IT228_00645 [Flavobacteriales bacterium]|nr:hypothetical protein [Flavobacteriales bacterium]MCC6575828.1 hypothetical protein [Flavobacteriales bacterium]NUQ14250.1 hypothetical protein [Flavobacteriales bacterium]